MRPVVYCVVPRDLAPQLHELLREHWADDPSIIVVVEQRQHQRRDEQDRRATTESPAKELRRVKRTSGRRVADRRVAATAPVPALPRAARRHARELTFLQRAEPGGRSALDADTDRLVWRVQQHGDSGAMAEIYLRYFDGVYRYARMMVRDAHDAEDITQQVFIKVLGAIDGYERKRSVPFRAWLFRIARNTVVDGLRRANRTAPEEPATMEELVDQRTSVDDIKLALHWLTDSDLATLMRRLPAGQREVLALRYLLDLETDQITEITGRSPKAVRQLQSRGLRSLETWLGAMGRQPVRPQREAMVARRRPAPITSARRRALEGTHAGHGAARR
jgi:RNA polymerase sigma-70 factor (ECF subfamily)